MNLSKVNVPFVSDFLPANTHILKQEQFMILEACEQAMPKIKRNMREWPLCSLGGKVNLGVEINKVNRGEKVIHLIWNCTCQQTE